MKRALVIIFLIAVAEANVFAQMRPRSEDRPSILDYYLLLPDKYLVIGGSDNQRINAIAIKDLPKGYLRIEGGWEGFSEIALFRKPDGGTLIGVVNNYCGPACKQRVFFVEPVDRDWVERTEEVLPEIPKQRLIDGYKLMKAKEDEDFGDDVPIMLVIPHTGAALKLIVQPEF